MLLAFVLKEKLKTLKEKLRTWNREIFEKVDMKVGNGVKELNELDYMVANGLKTASGNVGNSRMLATSKVWQNLQPYPEPT